MKITKQWMAILAFGGVVGFLAVRAPAPDEATKAAEPVARAVRHNSEKHDVAQVQLPQLQPRRFRDGAADDMFTGKSWFVPPPPPKYVPPPPPPPPAPPPPPSAPPLPYAFLGSYQEPGGKQVIYLTRSDRIYAVSPGDTLENTYRIETISGNLLAITYLPLNIKQTLRIGDRS